MIYAHPQTSEQCSEFLDKLGIEIIPTKSNAASAIELLDNREGCGGCIKEDFRDLQSAGNSSPILRTTLIMSRGFSGFQISRCRNPVRKSAVLLLIRQPTARVFSTNCSGCSEDAGLTSAGSSPAHRNEVWEVMSFSWTLRPPPGTEESLAELEGLTDIRRLGCYKRLEVNL